ncbi:MAG: DUF3795 domain-containing protein [Candidatus Helarchaeota archaeon]
MDDPKLLASCGVYCDVCPYLIAYKNNDEKLKKKLAKNVGITPEKVICEGCNSDLPFFFCRTCSLKKCVRKKEIVSCAVCDEYPCKKIEKYPYKPFLRKLNWDVNYQKQHGKKKWIEKTLELNTCPNCGTLNHWMAHACRSCNDKLAERY